MTPAELVDYAQENGLEDKILKKLKKNKYGFKICMFNKVGYTQHDGKVFLVRNINGTAYEYEVQMLQEKYLNKMLSHPEHSHAIIIERVDENGNPVNDVYCFYSRRADSEKALYRMAEEKFVELACIESVRDLQMALN